MKALTIHTALCLIALTLTMQASAADLTLPRDGWASWQVEAVEGAPDWCCWGDWDDRQAPKTACQLDGDNHGYGSRDNATTDTARVYARVADGKVDRVRVLSASCPVKTATPIHWDCRVGARDRRGAQER